MLGLAIARQALQTVFAVLMQAIEMTICPLKSDPPRYLAFQQIDPMAWSTQQECLGSGFVDEA